MDNDSRKVRIERRAERVLKAADEDRLINERIQWPAETAPLRTKRGPARRGTSRDDQDLKIGSICIRASERRRQHIRCYRPIVLMLLPIAGVPSERPIK